MHSLVLLLLYVQIRTKYYCKVKLLACESRLTERAVVLFLGSK